ncbi:MAG: O-antigen ligase family protein [Cetobacterium sp.]
MKKVNKISIIMVLIMGCFLRDRNLYMILPFIVGSLWGESWNRENLKKILYYLGIVGAIYGVLGLSWEGFITNRGIVLMATSVIGRYFYEKKEIKIPYKPIIYMYIFILIGGIIWNLLSPGRIEGIGRFVSVNKKFISIILFYNIIESREYFRKLLDIFLGGVVITGLYGIYQYMQMYFRAKGNLNALEWYRVEGFTNILYTGAVLMMGGILLFSNIWENFNWRNKKDWLYLIGLVIVTVGLFMTKTRACIIGYFLGIIYIIILNRNLKKTFIIILIGLGIGVGLPKKIKENLFERVTQITFKEKNRNQNTASDNFRRVMWRGSIYAWKNNKIFGTGSRGTGKWIQEYADKNTDKNGMIINGVPRKYFTYKEAHSMYLNFLSELGIFSLSYGMLLFIIIPGLIYKLMKKNIKEYNPEILGVSGAILSYYFLGTVWSVWGYYGSTQEVFQFMIFILIMIYEKNKEKEV